MMVSQINRQQTRRTTPLTIPSPISSTYLADWLFVIKEIDSHATIVSNRRLNMGKKENHHINPKENQKNILNVPFNKDIYDETTVPLDHEFHRDITNQIRRLKQYRDLPMGMPAAYTLGEIDKKLTIDAWTDDDEDED